MVSKANNLWKGEWIEELSARQLLNPDAGAHLHHTQISQDNWKSSDYPSRMIIVMPPQAEHSTFLTERRIITSELEL